MPTKKSINFVPTEAQKACKKGFNEKAHFVDKKGLRVDIPAKSDYSFGIPNLGGLNLTTVLLNVCERYLINIEGKAPSSKKNEASKAIDKMKELGVWSKMSPELRAPLLEASKAKSTTSLSQEDRSIAIFSLLGKLEKLGTAEKKFFTEQVKFLRNHLKIPVKSAKKE